MSLNNISTREKGDGKPNFTIIEPKEGWRFINFRELWQYRDLFFFLVWRDVKTRYAQSILGVGWAVIQPVFSMIVFTIVFGNLAKISSDGMPYAIFSYTALVPWIYFSSSLTAATGSLVASKNLITKVYFPRVIVPIAPVLSKLVDFTIAMLILVFMMYWFRITPTVWTLVLPLLILLMMLTAAGLGMWLTALSVQYRDINYAMGFVVQLLIYAAPVVYPTNSVPLQFRSIYSLNPMVGVIEGFRSALLNTNPMPWDYITIGAISAILILISGILYFQRMERIFADVV